MSAAARKFRTIWLPPGRPRIQTPANPILTSFGANARPFDGIRRTTTDQALVKVIDIGAVRCARQLFGKSFIMLKSGKTSVLLVALSGLLSSPVHAQDQNGENLGNRSGRQTPAATAVATATSAFSLAAYAREAGDAEAMLVAARMLASVGTLGEGEEPAVIESSSAAGSATSEAQTSATLFDEALELAQGDPSIVDRISVARASASRGLVGGASSWVRDISARSSVSYEITAQGGYIWNVVAAGDGDTDVDMEVFDQNGNLVCRDIAPYTRATCSITPAWTGRFTVKVSNLGNVWTRTLIMSN